MLARTFWISLFTLLLAVTLVLVTLPTPEPTISSSASGPLSQANGPYEHDHNNGKLD